MAKQNTDDKNKAKNAPNNSSLQSFDSSLLLFTLSKTSYCTGLQCPKILWLDMHKIGEKDTSAVNQARLDEDASVGELARGYFGDYTLIQNTVKKMFPHDNNFNYCEDTEEVQQEKALLEEILSNPELENEDYPSSFEDIKEVAKYFELTKKRIKRIEEKAYRKLLITRTKRLLKETDKLLGQDLVAVNSTFCEASFAAEGGFCRVDILRTMDDGSNVAAYEIIGVKSSTSVKPEHLDDMAFQYHILNASGLKVKKVSLLHINSQYERTSQTPLDGRLDLQNFFTLVDCTKEVLEKQKDLSTNIKRIKEIARAETEPDISIGKHCDYPYPCAYKQYCSGVKEAPPLW